MEQLGVATVNFVEKIEKLVKAGQVPQLGVQEILGSTYVSSNWQKIKPASDAVSLKSLSAFVDFVRTTVDVNSKEFSFPLQVKVSEFDVTLHSSLDEELDRNFIAKAVPNNPNIKFDSFMSKEAFIIQLQTCFIETDNKIKLLEMVKYLSDESKVETMDDGIGQQVTAQKGVSLRGAINLPPIINLTAYRTYKEVQQVETMYLLRAKDGGELALFEADGGMWKYEASLRVSAYLRDALKNEIAKGEVVIIG